MHPPYSSEQLRLIRRYVNPGRGASRRYLELLHGNFMRLKDAEGERRRLVPLFKDRGGPRGRFLRQLADAARTITDEELTALLEVGWRPRLTAAWLIGFDPREQFRDRLGALLLDSEVCFAGQGYCFALARFGTRSDAEILAAYLDHYLRLPDCRYDQEWAMGALLHVDARTGADADRADGFLVPGGLWQRWSDDASAAVEYRQAIDTFCGLAGLYMASGTGRVT
ncbi:DUF6000 family protein [Streptomyces sp. HC307]|uniref:DUF6000 family protein n=1 Tax=Streptomyces flavusporus TaxID=3385496 RepID=UPI003916CD1E